MSKAFTSDEHHDDGFDDIPALPPGVINYMTRAGADRFEAELLRLEAERRLLHRDDVTAANRIKAIERRIRFLGSRLETAQRIDPLQQPQDQVLFGATLTLSHDSGPDEVWRIVGIDEADLDRGWISWQSPLAAALLGRRTGDTVVFRNRQWQVKSIRYEA